MYVEPNMQFNHTKPSKPPSAGAGGIKTHIETQQLNSVSRIWFWFACCAKDVSTVGTLGSALSKPQFEKETYALQRDPG